MREKTGQVFFSKNETNPLPIASITKLMTASLALEYLDLFDRVLLTADARKNYDTGEKLSKVPAGETFKMEDALKLAVISSDNDIARALAEAAVAKARPELFSSPFAERMRMFTELMNRKREEIGMADSHFDNPTGIDSSENYSTARDLGRLASFIYRTHPRIWDVSRIAKTDVFSVGGNRYEAITTNPLLEEFPDIVGTKTGSTDGAKESLVLVYNVKTGEPIVIVVLRSDNRLRDARTLIDWLQNAYKF
ncbi:MAG: hypothetical protein A3H69_03520 [Candidatus Sungbacteria bacterium RIFCSPLOWO2_02_FULL_47_9]|nr:MAG: hypothetical protein A3H69_03520 [Candidatus Sungbacteria bacterium RIFCSPLOWO2_02_FULL_47_9]